MACIFCEKSNESFRKMQTSFSMSVYNLEDIFGCSAMLILRATWEKKNRIGIIGLRARDISLRYSYMGAINFPW